MPQRMTGLIGRNVAPLFLINIFKNGKRKYASQLAKEINVSLAYANQVVNRLVEENLVIRTKEGVIVYLTLSEKGKQIAQKFLEVKEILEK